MSISEYTTANWTGPSSLLKPSKLNVYKPCNALAEKGNEDNKKKILLQHGGVGHDVYLSTLAHLNLRPPECINIVAVECSITPQDVRRVWVALCCVSKNKRKTVWAKSIKNLAQQFSKPALGCQTIGAGAKKTDFLRALGLAPKVMICDVTVMIPQQESLIAEESKRPKCVLPYKLPNGIEAMRGAFICGVCSKVFREAQSLRHHKYTHSTRNTTVQLNRPIKGADGLFHCPHSGCTKKYPKDQALRVHLQSVHGPPVTCEICHLKLSCKAALGRHQKSQHPKA